MAKASPLRESIGFDPDNNALRLAYANELDKARDSQADFIRDGIKLETLAANGPGRAELAARVESLWKRNRNKWYAPCPAWARPDHLDHARGFPSDFCASVRDWRTKADELLKLFPVHRLHIRDKRPELAALVANERLPLVRILDLCHAEVGDRGAQVLARAPGVANLTGLLLFRTGIGPAGAAALAESRYLTRLTWLSLEENDVQSAGAIALAESSALRGLRRFSLRSNRIDEAAGRALATAGFLSAIESLRLGYLEIGPAGSAALLSANMPQLERLEFDYNAMGDEGAAALAANAAQLPRLTSLDMSYNQITSAGMKQLTASKLFTNLTHLRIGNPLGAEGTRHLARCRRLKRLESLDLYGSDVGDGGAEALARSPHLVNLQELCLGEAGIGPRGGLALAASPYLGGLKTIVLRGNDLDAESRRALRARFGKRAV